MPILAKGLMGYKENFLPYQRAHAFTIIARRASRLSAELLCEQYSNATLPGDRNIAVGESSRSCPILVYPPCRPCRYLAYPSCTPCRYLARLWRSCRMVRRHPCGRRRNEAPPPLWRVASAVHPPPPTTGGFCCALSSATGGCFFGGWFPLRAIPFPIKPLTSKNVKMPPRG